VRHRNTQSNRNQRTRKANHLSSTQERRTSGSSAPLWQVHEIRIKKQQRSHPGSIKNEIASIAPRLPKDKAKKYLSFHSLQNTETPACIDSDFKKMFVASG